MSKIIATDSFITKNWDIQFEDLKSNSADLQIRFTEEGPIVHFKDLKFSYRLSRDGEVLQSKSYPPTGVKYVQSDQEYLVTERLRLEAEVEYELYLWAENNGESFEKTVTFTTPRPPQPFASWTWDASTKQWNAPIPYPSDETSLRGYMWDEESGSWVKEPPPNVSLSRLNFMLRLHEIGIYETAEAAAKSEEISQRAKIMWNNADTFERLNPELQQWALNLGFSENQLDIIFNTV